MRKTKETWKSFVGFPNYEMSNLGNMRRKVVDVYKPLKWSYNGQIHLIKDGKFFSVSKRRLTYALERKLNPLGSWIVPHGNAKSSYLWIKRRSETLDCINPKLPKKIKNIQEKMVEYRKIRNNYIECFN